MNKLLSLIGFALFYALFLFSVGSNAEANGCSVYVEPYQYYGFSCLDMSINCNIPFKTFMRINNLDMKKDCGYEKVVLGKRYCCN
ncbi:hypothetical protein DDB_G0293854 [Dictyostelium discoideum AX4]|uniref:LysM domain-containing protein n=1 Tax=Dictyostelium discoideum TaxID=44689 RepID=Q54B78_DICDI|nr:hypothetical protein DDB_G0293854 [Dictyostelium discoideum AX4]EAL60498.1 hypothetical protein DDB_G0293854 [Dictyostelium discoideum AX4]|eukprot:XP_628910.1 hypothetical protein DDB_G0293854 [Dictyostelium discoideum AX4]